jgi:hypothetical protein
MIEQNTQEQNIQKSESILHDGKVQCWIFGVMAGIIPSLEAQAMVNEGTYRIINSQAIEWVGGA